MGSDKFVELKGVRYPRITIHWMDIVGDASTVTGEEAKTLMCPHCVTEGYLYDVFEQDGERYIRTFATYELGDDPSFGDRNCFPLSVLSKNSKRDVEFALIFMTKQ
jgi:hypothetical protein